MASGKFTSSFQASFLDRIVIILKTLAIGSDDNNWDSALAQIRNSNCAHDIFITVNPDDGKTILHYACERETRKKAEETARKIFQLCDHMENKQRIDFVNLKDNDDNTALQLATNNRNKGLIKLLIENGANIGLLKKNCHSETAYLIYDEVLVDIFDRSIQIVKDPDDVTNRAIWEIQCDFRPITGLHNPSLTFQEGDNGEMPLNQSNHLARQLRTGIVSRRVILQHPLAEIFLHLKEEKFKMLVYISIAYHILWSLASFFYIFHNTQQVPKKNESEDTYFLFEHLARTYHPALNNVTSPPLITVLMIGLWMISVFIEIWELINWSSKWGYFRHIRNIGQWISNLALLTLWVIALTPAETRAFEVEQSVEISVILGVYLAGMFGPLFLIQGQIAKIKYFGLYNAMYKEGFWKIIRFLVTFLPLLVTFLAVFHFLLPKTESSGIAKFIIMMTGELDFDDGLFEGLKEYGSFKNLLQIVFVVFIVTVVLLLHNLLIGVTVNDVERLEQKAKLNILKRRLGNIYLLETLATYPWIVKLLLHFKLKNWITSLLIDENLTQMEEKLRDGSVIKRGKRLDEYPKEIRKLILQWIKSIETTEIKENTDTSHLISN